MEKISGKQLINFLCNRLEEQGKICRDHQILKLLAELSEHELTHLIKNKK